MGIVLGLITIHMVVRVHVHFLKKMQLIQFASHEAGFVLWLLKVCSSRGYEEVMLILLLVSALFSGVTTGSPWLALGGYLALVLIFVVVLTAIEVQKLVSGDSGGLLRVPVDPEELKALLEKKDGDDTQPPSTDGLQSSLPDDPEGTKKDGAGGK